MTVEKYIVAGPEMAPVIHARWEYNGQADPICSNCGGEWLDGCQECGLGPSNTSFCPNCGAKMDLPPLVIPTKHPWE